MPPTGTKQLSAVSTGDLRKSALWQEKAVPFLATGLSLLIYQSTAAPGLTWRHFGADGGDLLAAAVTNGVPHPPGYPLYTILLQLWLVAGSWAQDGSLPFVQPAHLGNLLSAVCAAVSVGVTVHTVLRLLSQHNLRWMLALLSGMAWAISPLLWSQAVITEVYALHILLVALLGSAVLAPRPSAAWLVSVIALGVANHLTFLLLLPAVAYWLWIQQSLKFSIGTLAAGLAAGALLYIRIPVAAAAAPPVNWGYADNRFGFWWLVSGAAYRAYVFGLPLADSATRVAAWARTLSTQFTPVGLALALWGLAYIDRKAPALRDFSILWLAPVSIYAIFYYTWDSEVYLLPVVWIICIWLAFGLQRAVDVFQSLAVGRVPHPSFVLISLLWASLLILFIVRVPSLSLRQEDAAVDYLRQVSQSVPPDAIVVSSADAETFALWYGAWGSGDLLRAAPNLVLVNYALYQYPWYHRHLRSIYPDVPGIDVSLEMLLTENNRRRPIFFSEPLPVVPKDQLIPVGPLWQWQPSS